MSRDKDLGRPVNSLLGQKPSLGPIPGDQVIPWIIIASIAFAGKLFLGLSWLWTGFVFFWGISTWWILTGKQSWRFLNRFVRCPRWAKTFRFYESPLDNKGSEN